MRTTLHRAVTTTALAAALSVPLPATATATAASRLGDCASGQLCLWQRADFHGTRQVHELAGVSIESCVPLPQGTAVESLANRTGRPVTTYQDAECGETGEFDTFPGDGTWAPRTAYQVRAFKIWER